MKNDNDSLIHITQGHGLEGRYGGLPDPYGQRDGSKIAILPVAFDKTTTYQHGSDKGPGALIEASRNLELYDIETNSEVFLQGIWTAPAIQEETSEKMLSATYEKTKEFIQEGKFVITLGGEHSISAAPIRAHLDIYGPLTILQFDAHADLVPAYEGNPHSHASVMSRVKEMKDTLKIVSVGIRSMSSEEIPFIDHANTFFAHQLDKAGWMEELVDRLSPNVYITFDLDVFDSSLMPSTGTPEPGGLFWNQATKLLKMVIERRNLVGCDVVELLPNSDSAAPDYLAAKLCYKILSYRFKS